MSEHSDHEPNDGNAFETCSEYPPPEPYRPSESTVLCVCCGLPIEADEVGYTLNGDRQVHQGGCVGHLGKHLAVLAAQIAKLERHLDGPVTAVTGAGEQLNRRVSALEAPEPEPLSEDVLERARRVGQRYWAAQEMSAAADTMMRQWKDDILAIGKLLGCQRTSEVLGAVRALQAEAELGALVRKLSSPWTMGRDTTHDCAWVQLGPDASPIVRDSLEAVLRAALGEEPAG